MVDWTASVPQGKITVELIASTHDEELEQVLLTYTKAKIGEDLIEQYQRLKNLPEPFGVVYSTLVVEECVASVGFSGCQQDDGAAQYLDWAIRGYLALGMDKMAECVAAIYNGFCEFLMNGGEYRGVKYASPEEYFERTPLNELARPFCRLIPKAKRHRIDYIRKNAEEFTKTKRPPRPKAVVGDPASEEDLRYLEEMGYPQSVIELYSRTEPDEMEINDVILNSIGAIRDSAAIVLPDCVVTRFGYLNIATTRYGDTYCIDLNSKHGHDEPPVVMISHEQVHEGSSRDEVEASAVRAAASFEEFLWKFLKGRLPADYYENQQT